MTESCSEDGGSEFALKLQELHGNTPRTPRPKLVPPGELECPELNSTQKAF